MSRIENRALILDLKETAISTDLACTSADVEPSHMIAVMHDEQNAHADTDLSSRL